MSEITEKPLVIITGASSGIGAATAKVFNDAGYPLLLLARRVEKMRALGIENAMCEELDVTDFEAFVDVIDSVSKSYSQIGCLINNAGIISVGDFIKIDIQQEKRMLDVNVLGVINGVKAVFPYMQRQKFGTVINISSIGDRTHGYHAAVYCATKAAIKSLTESWRKGNFDKNIRFCNLAPAYVETPIWDAFESPQYKELLEKRELITAKQFADMILWIYEQPQHISIRDMLVAPTASEL